MHGRGRVQGSSRPHRMELQHGQQSQDHKGLFPSPPDKKKKKKKKRHTYAHKHTPPTVWPTSNSAKSYLSPLLFVFMSVLSLSTNSFSALPPLPRHTHTHTLLSLFLFTHPIFSLHHLLLPPILAATSNSFRRKTRPSGTSQITHTHTHREGEHCNTCPVSLHVTGVPSDLI